MADIAEQICLAVDQIVTQRLQSINYDTTIVATIIDNTYASENRYTCSNGSAQFIAFSKDTTFKINDSVQVTIPNNDYNQQKIIVGRYVAKDQKPYVFTQPFSTIIDVSSNLIDNNNKTISGSLLANDDYDKTSYNANSKKYDIAIKENVLWSNVFEEGYTDFNRLGIQGQFRSWIAALKPISGSYGYRLEILSNNGETIENSGLISDWAHIYTSINSKQQYDALNLLNITPESWYKKVKDTLKLTAVDGSFKTAFINTFKSAQNKNPYSETCKDMTYVLLYANAQITELFLDSSDMYGNPYNFQSFFEQEKVYDISSLGVIFGMTLYFYEKSATFYSENKDYMPYTTLTGGKLAPNLFTKDPYVCLGYDLSEFDTEQAILYTLDGETYISRDDIEPLLNQKTVRLRWLHQYENGQIKVITEASEIKDYEVRWYRFKMGAPSADEYSGVYWEPVKASVESVFSYTFSPGVNVASEQIKAIILYEGKVIRSNIITFTSEVDVASPATAEVLSGLSIWCADNSYGNYCRYGQDNNLMETEKLTPNTVFSFEARFADQSLLAAEYDIDKVAAIVQEAKEIIWEIPLNNSMIVVQGFNYSYTIANDEVSADGSLKYNLIYQRDNANGGSRYKLPGFYGDATIKVRGNTIYITRVCSSDGKIVATQDYRIGKTYNASKLNNTVKCSIKKNGLIYSATKELIFGLMGTNGTDATVVIDFNNNKTALTADLTNETLKVTAHLYDSSHKEVDFNDLGLGLSCKWSWLYYQVEPGQNITLRQRFKENSNGDWVLNDDTIPINVCYLSHNTQLSIENKKFFLILQVVISGFGDYDLTSFKAIPIRASTQYRNIIGPTDIIYSSSGYPNYYKDAFQLWWCADPSKVNEQYDIVADETAITQAATDWDIYNPLAESANFIGEISNNILKPASVYTKNADPYGAICYLNTVDSKTEPVWIQPFVIMQNEYPSATINKWDGKTVELNEDEGYIISPAIAAGKKNSDNTFSGVMIGDWSETNTAADLTKMTGVYGFHEGAVSFAFKEDGTAFIGKSGRGRILFDGNSGILKSESWTDASQTGMHLDLDDGVLRLQKEPGYDQINLTADSYRPNQYYILETTYNKVALNTPYNANLTYYKKAMVQIARMTEASFIKKRNARTLYIRNALTYKQCSSSMAYDSSANYYQYSYSAVTVTKENYDKNKSNYFVKSGNSYVQASGSWSETTQYYIRSLNRVYPTETQYKASPTSYYIRNPYTYSLVSTSATYDEATNYYEYGYEAQNYGLIPLPDNWNTVADLGSGNYYYTATEKYVLSAETAFDATQTYYEDNRGLSARYITLSAAANRFPLAIGNHSSESSRKFRVDWDGTCYIEDGIFSGDINANSGYLGDLVLRGGLTVNRGGYIILNAGAYMELKRDGYIQLTRGGYIDLDGESYIHLNKDGFIKLDEGGFIELDKGGFIFLKEKGYIASMKKELNDFNTNGFWLSSDGINIGSTKNYFYASTEASLFYNNYGLIKISGEGIDLFGKAGGIAPSDAYNVAMNEDALVHFGWSSGQYAYPYLRLGRGTVASGDGAYMHDAGMVKKYDMGIWIGMQGKNLAGDSPESDDLSRAGMFFNFETYTVMRCEYVGGKRVFEPARYARFAPDDL